jgi:hypothetical protein
MISPRRLRAPRSGAIFIELESPPFMFCEPSEMSAISLGSLILVRAHFYKYFVPTARAICLTLMLSSASVTFCFLV